MEFLKKTIFFLLMPIYVPLTLLNNATYDWWAGMSEGNKPLFFILMPLYVPLSFFLLWTFPWWVKLSE